MQFNLTRNILENYRQQSDTIADLTVKKLTEEYNNESLWKLYQQLINDLDELDYEQLDSTLKTYFIQNQTIPTWANANLVKIAEALFLDIGPVYSACLLCRALPIGYSSAKTVKVLTSTGYLSKDVKQGTAKRLLETTQFIFNVMEENTFVLNSKGIKHILKVRLLHAIIRYHLLKHNWDENKYDIPINQEDMAGTILTFSVGAIKGLQVLNIELSEIEKNALVHYWAVIGALIGVDEKLLPQNYTEGEHLYEKILDHQAKHTPDGEVLTKALCNFIRGFLPVTGISDFPEYLVQHLINNPKYSDLIGLHKPRNSKDQLMFGMLMWYLKKLNQYRKKPLTNSLVKKTNKIFATKLANYFANEFEMQLNVPETIKTAWGLT